MNKDPMPGASTDLPPAPHLTDEEIIRLAGRAKNGPKFRGLWDGDRKGYCSPSEADLALCGILAFYAQGDADRVEDLFARSGLGKRDKWRRSKRYRDLTIREAVAGLPAFYGPRQATLVRGARSYQALSGFTRNKNTADGPKATIVDGEQGMCGDGRRSVSALDLAETDRELPMWRASFNLARRIRTVATSNPERFEAEVRAYCEQAGRSFDEFWCDFLVVWEVVRKPEGDNVLAWAKKRTEEEPYILPCSKGKYYDLVGGMAFYLNSLSEGKPFWLPRENIGRLLGVTGQTISNAVKLLVKDKVLTCTKDKWSYVDGQCKEYIFTGPPLLMGRDTDVVPPAVPVP